MCMCMCVWYLVLYHVYHNLWLSRISTYPQPPFSKKRPVCASMASARNSCCMATSFSHLNDLNQYNQYHQYNQYVLKSSWQPGAITPITSTSQSYCGHLYLSN